MDHNTWYNIARDPKNHIDRVDFRKLAQLVESRGAFRVTNTDAAGGIKHIVFADMSEMSFKRAPVRASEMMALEVTSPSRTSSAIGKFYRFKNSLAQSQYKNAAYTNEKAHSFIAPRGGTFQVIGNNPRTGAIIEIKINDDVFSDNGSALMLRSELARYFEETSNIIDVQSAYDYAVKVHGNVDNMTIGRINELYSKRRSFEADIKGRIQAQRKIIEDANAIIAKLESSL